MTRENMPTFLSMGEEGREGAERPLSRSRRVDGGIMNDLDVWCFCEYWLGSLLAN
jgi:hypothetical protein